MLTKKSLGIGAFAVGIAFAAGAAQAGSITVNGTNFVASNPVTLGSSNSPNFTFSGVATSQSLTVAQFDTQGGTRTLTSIDFQLVANADGQYNFTRNGGSPNAKDYTINFSASFDLNDGTTSYATAAGTGQAAEALKGGQSTGNQTVSTSGSSGVVTYFGPFTSFEGVGNVSLTIDMLGSGSISSADVSGLIKLISTNSVIVTYNFDTNTPGVPEPMSMALLGAGLLGLGMVRRRRS